MARIEMNTSESIFQIKKWLGVNEAPEGEARLRQGEAAAMRNFRITAGGALRKRSGSVNVAGLMTSYNIVVGEEETVIQSVKAYKGAKVPELFPRATTDSVGKPITDGEGQNVAIEEFPEHAGSYLSARGNVYRLTGSDYVRDEEPGAVSIFPTDSVYMLLWDNVPVLQDGQWDVENARVVDVGKENAKGKYTVPNSDNLDSSGAVYFSSWGKLPEKTKFLKYMTSCDHYLRLKKSEVIREWNGREQEPSVRIEWDHVYWAYQLRGFPVSSAANPEDAVVRGLWSGFVNGEEVLCAACNGHLWQLLYRDGAWSKTRCGEIDTGRDVSMFGFEEKLYILNGSQYKVWNGTTMEDVAGYVPLVLDQVTPAGIGNSREQANKLTGKRRCTYSPDGESKTFVLPENGGTVESIKDVATGKLLEGWTAEAGSFTLASAPPKGIDSLEVCWDCGKDSRDEVRAMRYMELYNGAQDSRVFLYGDGSNRCFYSGLDNNGQPRADYFPDMNVAHIGDANTPVTAMIRHYDKLLAFKLDSAYSMSYSTLTLADGKTAAAFYITPVNRSVGNCAPGQAVLVENQPRTLDGRSVMEWRAGSYGSFSGDQRNAQRISQRVDNSIRSFDLTTAKTFYDKYTHEYYVIGQEGTALVHEIEADAWTIYTGFAARCLIRYKDELYFGTADGYLRHFTDTAFSDEGAPIDCYWESGAMPFERDYTRKYSAMIWVGIKPEENGYLQVTAETDRKSDFAEYSFKTEDAGAVPKMHRIKLKAKKFTYYKLILTNNTADSTATVVSADVRVRNTGYVR